MEKAEKTLPDAPLPAAGESGEHAAKKVLQEPASSGEAGAAKPLFTLGALFPEFSGKSLFGAPTEGQTGLFGGFKSTGLFSKAVEATRDSEDEAEQEIPAAEPSEDEAELLRRHPGPEQNVTIYAPLARKEVANFRVNGGDSFGPGSVAIEQLKERDEVRQLVMRNKAKNILYSCLLVKGLTKTVELKGKPGLSLFGYSLPKAETEAQPSTEEPAQTETKELDQAQVEKTVQVEAEESAQIETKDSAQTEGKESASVEAKGVAATVEESEKDADKSGKTHEAASKPSLARDNVKMLFLSATDAQEFLAELVKLDQ